ncbi:hypothetical protein CLAFUW4_13012 [Fulvia fulva]|uniref:Heterokaryon incompatibility domain-containing protein n=1 Tax=Passalora fulva TaxID=5499 RepID=A0A9Q8PJY7_PASFU|nr:uncharacterized protein CLAFUR5_12873 [Fulvia fulva]KAK4612266.1 hypothetical protein CLAFUR4_13016 [Fulvia fulva]UJO23764.1 hypothetical protein CLAFUR5_12873 [Fulvia fulva]WPV21531.1 hypothetical protein CLAFUW4_13012 [Fulvia fulva]WPV35945.1 hypothetical protein CLAFUW7_13019 [Fulvia fulva]
MKGIYEGAASVFAWLGMPDDDAQIKDAIDLMVKSFDVFSEDIEALDGGIHPVKWDKDHALFPHDGCSDTDQAWRTVTAICDLPYFRRVWIHQEATTPGEVRFWIGKHNFDGDLMLMIVLCAHRFAEVWEFPAGLAKSVGMRSHIAHVTMARVDRERPGPQPLVDILADVRIASCADQRDKVFVALAHAAEISTMDIVVDYDRSLEEVYLDIAHFALERHGLDMLGLVYTHGPGLHPDFLSLAEAPRLPTWVPDWRQRLRIMALTNEVRVLEDGSPIYNPLPGTITKYETKGAALRKRLSKTIMAPTCTRWPAGERSSTHAGKPRATHEHSWDGSNSS